MKLKKEDVQKIKAFIDKESTRKAQEIFDKEFSTIINSTDSNKDEDTTKTQTQTQTEEKGITIDELISNYEKAENEKGDK